MALLSLQNIKKSYGKGSSRTDVFTDLNLSMEEGEMLAVMGKSGAGKTTLLNIIAGIDYPDHGEYLFDDTPVVLKTTSDGIRFRRNRIGIVVQHFALINDFTVYENVEMGLWESHMSKKEQKARAREVLSLLGIELLAHKFPPELSGGEKQRTAIGRAIVAKPRLLLADEPTGALDTETEQSIMSTLLDLHRSGTTMLVITHDNDIASMCSRITVLQKH